MTKYLVYIKYTLYRKYFVYLFLVKRIILLIVLPYHNFHCNLHYCLIFSTSSIYFRSVCYVVSLLFPDYGLFENISRYPFYSDITFIIHFVETQLKRIILWPRPLFRFSITFAMFSAYLLTQYHAINTIRYFSYYFKSG